MVMIRGVQCRYIYQDRVHDQNICHSDLPQKLRLMSCGGLGAEVESGDHIIY